MDTLTLPTLSKGNPKTGAKIVTYSRAPGVTCPGASDWCNASDGGACYANQAYRMYVNTRRQWDENAITSEIPVLPKGPKNLRIHVSGDFDSIPYIMGWVAALKYRPDITAWAYTRSWIVPGLMPALEKLRALPNVQLFASCDPTMPDPPVGWRVAWIAGDERARGPECMEQTGAKNDCDSCGFCFRGKRNDIQFITHPLGRKNPGNHLHTRRKAKKTA